jgi:L-2-hydroxyglutarate oxidase LhgO
VRLGECGGLGAWDVAAALDGLPATKIPAAYYARGHYMTYSGQVPVKRLVYPLAQAGGLGIHLTLDLAGYARFGPDVLWLQQPDYSDCNSPTITWRPIWQRLSLMAIGNTVLRALDNDKE